MFLGSHIFYLKSSLLSRFFLLAFVHDGKVEVGSEQTFGFLGGEKHGRDAYTVGTEFPLAVGLLFRFEQRLPEHAPRSRETWAIEIYVQSIV